MRRDVDTDETPGGDSFLDIVANMVGILVLLVVVVGVRAGRYVAPSTPPKPPASEQVVADAKAAIDDALQSRRDVASLIEQAAYTQAESELRNHARDELASYAALLRAELAEERRALSATDQETLDTRTDLARAQLEIDELSRRQLALLSAAPSEETATIEIDPTPIVRERVKDEVWVRLEGDRVTFLPIGELEQELEYQRQSIRTTLMSASGDEASVERVVGPIDGFVLRCLYQRRRVATPEGAMLVGGLRVARIESPGTPLSEAVADATAPGSYLYSRLDDVDPAKTVVTVVTYPDSFDVLTELEAKLRESGFRVAKALLPEGAAITFSPNGRSTVLQ